MHQLNRILQIIFIGTIIIITIITIIIIIITITIVIPKPTTHKIFPLPLHFLSSPPPPTQITAIAVAKTIYAYLYLTETSSRNSVSTYTSFLNPKNYDPAVDKTNYVDTEFLERKKRKEINKIPTRVRARNLKIVERRSLSDEAAGAPARAPAPARRRWRRRPEAPRDAALAVAEQPEPGALQLRELQPQRGQQPAVQRGLGQHCHRYICQLTLSRSLFHLPFYLSFFYLFFSIPFYSSFLFLLFLHGLNFFNEIF